jgi:hypothetical protein
MKNQLHHLVFIGYLLMVLWVMFHPLLLPATPSDTAGLDDIGRGVGESLSNHLTQVFRNYIPSGLGALIGLVGLLTARQSKVQNSFMMGLITSVIVLGLTYIIRGA